jgi:anti-sigma factor RsiW
VNCAHLQQVLDAYVDRELDPATAGEIDRHLAGCAACASLHEDRVALGRAIRAEVPRSAAPETLRRSVRDALARARAPSSHLRLTWPQAGVLATAAAAAGLAAGLWLGQPPRDDGLPEQVVASHVASLAPGRQLTDVPAGDHHAIKPWFVGKTDFAPVVRDLAPEGFELVGARLDHVGDRQAAAVVYRVRNHYVNLFAWRADRVTRVEVRMATARGFGVASWNAGGLRFAAVSDIDPRDLERFARLVAQP